MTREPRGPRKKSPKHDPNRHPDATPEARASNKVATLWKEGDLFHATYRYPRKHDVARIDRLAGILQRGLIAPACCSQGLVCSDLNIVATGFDFAYDSLVFLHRFGSRSWLYTVQQPGRFVVFVDPAVPVLTQQAMGKNWVVLCGDEVYVEDRIEPEQLIGLAVHPADADSVLSEFLNDLRRLALPMYDYEGNVLWPRGKTLHEVRPPDSKKRRRNHEPQQGDKV